MFPIDRRKITLMQGMTQSLRKFRNLQAALKLSAKFVGFEIV